MADDSDKSIHK